MHDFPSSPKALVHAVWKNRQLVSQLTRNEIASRYAGSLFGFGWALLVPVLMISVYTFIFGVVFKGHWRTNNETTGQFALIAFVGLMVFNLAAECINRAPGQIVQNSNYVKKVVFPLESLAVVSLAVSLFNFSVNLVIWLCFFLTIAGEMHLTLVFLPVVVLPLVLFILGVTWFLQSLGVYLRDVGQFVSVLTSALLFLSPIFFPITALPPAVQKVQHANPLAITIEQARDVLVWGKMPDMSILAILTACGLLTAWLGFVWFQKTRRGFADVV